MTNKITPRYYPCMSPRKFPQNISHEISDLTEKNTAILQKIHSDIFLSCNVLGENHGPFSSSSFIKIIRHA